MSSLQIGIVGLPNVGKSTLFNALTKNNVLAANYPFATIEPNVGIVPVPDERLGQLAEIYHPEKVIPATVTFVDIAGLVRGASQGEGLGNKFLANIRETSAIVQVVRVFNDPNVTHVAGRIDPKDDIDTIQTELILADIQSIDNRLPKAEAEAKKDPKLKPLVEALKQARQVLDDGKLLSSVFPPLSSSGLTGGSITDEALAALRDLQLLTTKPFIYAFNLDEADLDNKAKQEELRQLVTPSPAVFLCAKVEAELMELPAAEAAELLQSLGQDHSGLQQLAEVGYRTLGLQTFLTAGPKEVRAWTIHQGDTAPQAAGVIHTDFEKGFIKAEIVTYDDLIDAGSLASAKSRGQVRLEGKDYEMRDGDVVEFRFNV